MIFEILCPYNGKDYVLIFRTISHPDGITMYFGTLKNDSTVRFNCMRIDQQQTFITLSENICPKLQAALLERVNAFEVKRHLKNTQITVAV